jgi:hypothetical protein
VESRIDNCWDAAATHLLLTAQLLRGSRVRRRPERSHRRLERVTAVERAATATAAAAAAAEEGVKLCRLGCTRRRRQRARQRCLRLVV